MSENKKSVIHFLKTYVRSMSCFHCHRDLKWQEMLPEQKTYLEIAEKTGASTATISRVNRSLNYGNDGYDMVFKRVGLAEEENGQTEE